MFIWDRCAREQIFSPERVTFSTVERRLAQASKVYMSMQETLCESLHVAEGFQWSHIIFAATAWSALGENPEINPERMANLARQRFPQARILIVIRDQVEWLGSAYRYYLANLEADRRRFSEFCATPKGTVLLQAANHDRTIETYGQAFGPSSVTALKYEHLKHSPALFLSSLCEFLAVQPMAFESEAVNKGRSVWSTRLLMRFPALAMIPVPLKRLGGLLLSGFSASDGNAR